MLSISGEMVILWLVVRASRRRPCSALGNRARFRNRFPQGGGLRGACRRRGGRAIL